MKSLLTATALSLAVLAGAAHAAPLDTVAWAADGVADGTGTGALAGSGTTVTYSTIVGVGNAGITVGESWAVSAATDDAVPDGVTQELGGVLGASIATSPVAQTISFSAAIVDPILLLNFATSDMSFDFTGLSLTLLDSNNAMLIGSMVTFPGAANGANDGFAARIDGTFGPGTDLAFSMTSLLDFQSVGFTIGEAETVSSPGALLLIGGGFAAAGLVSRHRRKA